MTKMRSDNERLVAQNNLDFIGGLIQNIIPQMINVRRILKARIPIVKFLHGSSGIDCDICIDNRCVLCDFVLITSVLIVIFVLITGVFFVMY